MAWGLTATPPGFLLLLDMAAATPIAVPATKPPTKKRTIPGGGFDSHRAILQATHMANWRLRIHDCDLLRSYRRRATVVIEDIGGTFIGTNAIARC